MDVEEIPVPPYTAFRPLGGRRVGDGAPIQPSPGASPADVVGLRDEIRHLRRELRYQQERAERNLQYERDRADRLARDADQARRRAAMAADELHGKRIELVMLEARVEDLQIRLRAQQAANRRHEAAATARRLASQRADARRALQPGGWLRGDMLLSGLIGVCIGKALAVRDTIAAAGADEPPVAERGTADGGGSQEPDQTDAFSGGTARSELSIEGSAVGVGSGESAPAGNDEALPVPPDKVHDGGEATVAVHAMVPRPGRPARSSGLEDDAYEITPAFAAGLEDVDDLIHPDRLMGDRTQALCGRNRLFPPKPQRLVPPLRARQRLGITKRSNAPSLCARQSGHRRGGAGVQASPLSKARPRGHMRGPRPRSSVRGQFASRRARRPPVRPPG